MVLPAFVRRWMNRKGFTSPRGRQAAAGRRPRLHLEALEDRCLPSVLTVTNLADSGLGSLRDAIARASNFDTVTFDPSLRGGTITLTSGELLLNKNLSIEGPGADSLAVSGGGASRVFEVQQGWSVSLSGLTIADGRVTGAAGFGGAVLNAGTLRVSGITFEGNTAAAAGGAVRNNGSLTVLDSFFADNSAFDAGAILNGGSLTLLGTTFQRNTAAQTGSGGAVVNGGQLAVADCTFTDNAAYFGGAVESDGGQVTVVHSTLRGNRGGNGGGGLRIYAGSLTLSDSLLADNSAVSGGGLYTTTFGGTVLVERTTFTGNHTTGVGGALYDTFSSLTIDASTVADNTASSGGGLYTYGAQVTVRASTFSGNTASDGGAVIVSSGRLDVVNSTFAGNRAGYYGGAVYADFNGGLFTFTSSTVAGNSAFYGGGLAFFSGRVTLHNTLVAANTAEDSGSANLFAYITAESGSSYNLIGPGVSQVAGLVNGVNHNQVGITDPGLGALGDHGGPTQTMALLPGSPALNAGDPGLAGTPDQRGVVRSGGANVGAYQASASAFALTAAATATAGVPFDVTVTAVDAFGQTAVEYTGTVQFTSSDGRATLPGDYTFTAADTGTHTFSGVTFHRPGPQSLTVTDTVDASILGTIAVLVQRPGQDDQGQDGQ
jgi:hypothetical protein